MILGVGICWPKGSRRLATIAATGRIPLFGRPRLATIPGSRVALVDVDGEVLLRGTLQSIDGPKPVRLADGKFRRTGYELVIKSGSLRTLADRSLGNIPFKWRVVGQMQYFDPSTNKPAIQSTEYEGGPYLADAGTSAGEVKFRRFAGVIDAMKRNAPEAKLVRRYASWIGGSDRFQQSQYLLDGCWTDLFNRTRWTLYEAKASASDRYVREAFGQLHDYRRWFPRSPRLAVLVPERPRARLLNFLASYNVSAIWERGSGGFSDSVNGRLTAELRTFYKARGTR